MGKAGELRFFLTPAHPCSYLADQQARTLFVSPDARIDVALQSHLSRAGFRRSGEYLYRPQCDACSACVPVRIPVQQHRPRRRHRRSLARNADLRLAIAPAKRDDALYALYERYIGARHQDGDMYPASEAQFDNFLLCSWGRSLIVRAYDDTRLVAAGVVDVLDDGLSAVYSFFDPDLEQRGLGTFLVLAEIEIAKEWGLPYLYLGYWIGACDKMRYKAEFTPQEQFISGCWVMRTS